MLKQYHNKWQENKEYIGVRSMHKVNETTVLAHWYWAVHTFFPFMPPSEFFDSHPEYYSLIDGERIHERAQLCLTNSDVLEIVLDSVAAYFEREPEANVISVSQDDNIQY